MFLMPFDLTNKMTAEQIVLEFELLPLYYNKKNIVPPKFSRQLQHLIGLIVKRQIEHRKINKFASDKTSIRFL